MVNNTLLVVNGKKVVVNRLGKAVPDYTILSRFKVAINTADIAVGDTTLATLVPIQGTELVDACNATTGWTASGTNSLSVNSTTFKPDATTDGALNIIKSDATSATVTASKTTTSVNGTSKDLLIWIYVKDAAALAKILSAVIRFGSDSSNYYYKDYGQVDFLVGWNFIKLAIPTGFTGTTLTPDIAALDYTYIAFVTNNITDTFVAGDIIFDAIRVASADDYYKTVDSINIDEADGSLTTISKLSVSDANGFLLNGLGIENTDTTSLMGVKSKYTNYSKGTSDLLKYTTKLKFRNVGE